MQVSEIRIKLVANRTDRLKAFATVTFDNDFVVRDLKVIEGADGYFVAMPSRKLTDRCPSCGAKNHLRARFCSDCGTRLTENRARAGTSGRTKLHADVAHPVNSECRSYIQSELVKAYQREVELSKQPDYRPTSLGDDYDDYDSGEYHREASPAAGGSPTQSDATAPPPGATEAEAQPPDAAEAEPQPPAGKKDEPPADFSEGIC